MTKGAKINYSEVDTHPMKRDTEWQSVRLSKDTKVLKGKRGGTVWSREATLLSSRHKWYLEYERKCKNKPFI